MSDIKSFNKQKQNLIEILIQLKNKKNEYKNLSNNNSTETKASNEVIEQHIKNLEQDAFRVMIIGEFSTGKSTFLNSILKEKILPTAVRPTTATINLIKFNKEKKAIVHYFGDIDEENNDEIGEGEQIEIPIANLSDYSTSLNDDSDKVSKEIKLVEVLYPNEFCKGGIEIIDTPGLNSTYGHHERATTEYLPNGNSGIMLFNAGQFLTKSESDYLEVFKKYLNKMFFVVNKVDGENKEEYLQSISFWKNQLKKILGEETEIRLYPVSALEASKGKIEESGMKEFLNDFEEFLTSDDKAREMINPSIMNAQNEIKNVTSNIQLQIKSIKFSPEEFELKLKSHMPKLERAKRRKIEIEKLIYDQGSFIKLKMEIEFNSLVRDIISSVSDEIVIWEGGIEELKDELPQIVKKNVTALVHKFQKKVGKEIKKLNKEVVSRISDLREDLSDFKSSLLGNNKISKELAVYDNVDIQTISDNFDTVVEYGGHLGIGWMAGLLIGGPFALIAAFGGSYIWGLISSEKKREKQLNQISEKVREQLNKTFMEQYPNIEKRMTKGINHIQKQTSELFTNMIDDVEETIKNIKIDMKKEKKEIEVKIKNYRNINDEFLIIGNNLNDIIKTIEA